MHTSDKGDCRCLQYVVHIYIYIRVCARWQSKGHWSNDVQIMSKHKFNMSHHCLSTCAKTDIWHYAWYLLRHFVENVASIFFFDIFCYLFDEWPDPEKVNLIQLWCEFGLQLELTVKAASRLFFFSIILNFAVFERVIYIQVLIIPSWHRLSPTLPNIGKNFMQTANEQLSIGVKRIKCS